MIEEAAYARAIIGIARFIWEKRKRKTKDRRNGGSSSVSRGGSACRGGVGITRLASLHFILPSMEGMCQ